MKHSDDHFPPEAHADVRPVLPVSDGHTPEFTAWTGDGPPAVFGSTADRPARDVGLVLALALGGGAALAAVPVLIALAGHLLG